MTTVFIKLSHLTYFRSMSFVGTKQVVKTPINKLVFHLNHTIIFEAKMIRSNPRQYYVEGL